MKWLQYLKGPSKAICFILALNGFFVAIKLLGAFKEIGCGMGESMMVTLAGQPILGLLLGILVTSIIQSSSTTTSLVVGLAATGVFGDTPDTAMQVAVPLIMGANIGTTVTNTIVSLSHVGDHREFRRAFEAATIHDVFNLMTVVILLPLQIATNFIGIAALSVTNLLEQVGGLRLASPLKLLVEPQVSIVKNLFDNPNLVSFTVLFALAGGTVATLIYLGTHNQNRRKSFIRAAIAAAILAGAALVVQIHHETIFSKPTAVFLTGLASLLSSLWIMVTIMRSVVLTRLQRAFQAHIFKTTARAMAVGLLITVLVQSSSVTTSLVVPLAGTGLVTLTQVFPFSLGANLGTTITALTAALSLGEPIALAVALAHLIFNFCGIVIFLPLKRLPIIVAQWLSATALRYPPFPAVYVLGIYLILPLVLIWLLGHH